MELTSNFLVKEYIENARSTYDIASELNISPQLVRRALQKFGIPIRTRAEAQKLALQSGRRIHPTKGKQRPLSVREKISDTVSAQVQTLSQEERQRRKNQAKERWDSMTEQEKENWRKKGVKALQHTSRDGSKLEKELMLKLNIAGFPVEFHKEHFMQNERLQMDLFLPTIKTAIEIDGPHHFLPIWGEERLQKHQLADAQKTGLLLTQGFAIIRLRHMGQKLSQKKRRDIAVKVLQVCETIKTAFPPEDKRFIEIDISEL